MSAHDWEAWVLAALALAAALLMVGIFIAVVAP